MREVDNSDFRDWLSHPVTRLLHKHLDGHIAEYTEHVLSEVGALAPMEERARIYGRYEVVEYIRNLTLEDVNQDESKTNGT